MSLKHSLFLFAALFTVQQAAHASVTIQLNVASLRDSGGSVIPANTTIVLVADTNGFSNGAALGAELSGLNLTAGNTFGDGGKIVGVFSASDLNAGDIGLSGTLNNLDLAAFGLTGGAGTAGSDLAVLWFPNLTGTGTQTLANGQSFGFYRSDTIDADSYGGTAPSDAISFNVPTDGGSYQLTALDSNLDGSVPNSSLTANLTVTAVPEPSRLAFLFLGLAGLITRRKRK